MIRYIKLMLILSMALCADNLLSEVQKNGLTIVNKHGKKVTIHREKNPLCTSKNINPEALFGGDFAGKNVADVCKKTFVTKVGLLQPMHLGQEIKTVGELEVLAHIKHAQESPKKYVLIDARTAPWFDQMTIPTSVNLPFNEINYDEDKEEDDFKNEDDYEDYVDEYERMFEILNIKQTKDGLDFSEVKCLILYCNGSWCSQSPNAIFKLINMGYPKDKLLWYRGGVQDWLIYDFTVTKMN
ncbi:MAG: Rhodanese-like domain-containing protein [uncultured Sulfurovum sp.]|uniref:Rhodanese-like domain-containing protein n=1 Tax=uncultured Sulfurovum sp. TaxID=269237 RepID=A0A6S6TFG3_9BACT|nr:MAG: Rhodanese-like domain-containing protein [uncultured Sulfurovum sp.]